jgi:hypothetical protein
MKRSTTLAGIGGIAFSVLTLVAFLLAAPPGGTYHVKDVADFVAKGHRTAVIVAFHVGMLGVLGLVLLLAYLGRQIAADTSGAATIFLGTGTAAAASFAVGWGIICGQIIARTEAGRSLAVSLDLTYVIGEIGVIMIFGAGAILLGFALLAFALSGRVPFPAWLRWFTAAAGVASLASVAFFPFFVLLAWAIVIGVWLLVSGRRAEPLSAT